jgi:hypothetical protein
MTPIETLIAKCDLNKLVIRQEERINRLENQLATLVQAAQFSLSLADGEPMTASEIAWLRSEVESAEDMLGDPEANHYTGEHANDTA